MKKFYPLNYLPAPALPAGGGILWAKKKKRKAPATAPKPAVRKRKPALAAKPRKARQDSWAMRLERGIGGWFDGAGLDGYEPRDWGRLGLLVAGLAVVLLIYSFSAGGYFIVRRGWGELIILYLIVLGLLFSLSVAGRLRRMAMAEMGLIGAYGLWILLSVTWSLIPTNSYQEFLRTMLYLGGFALFYLFMSKREWLPWLGHLFVAIAFIVALAALKTKIFPDQQPFDFDARLSWPLTYWNSVAMMMVMAFVISLQAVARKGASLLMRMAYIPAMFILLTVLFFTFSRAGYIFAALALAIYVLAAVERLRALLVAGIALFWTGAVVLACYTFLPAMKALSPTLDERNSQGHSLGIVLACLFVAAVAGEALYWWLDQKIEISAAATKKIGYGLAVAGAVVLLAVFSGLMVKKGGPVALVRAQIDNLTSTQKESADATAEQRLFNTQTERGQEYKVSLETFADHPLTGTGASTWEVAWLQRRPAFTDSNGKVYDVPIKNGHSIFFDALAELGIVGAGLLAAFMVVFFVGSIRDLRFLGRSRHREIYGAFFAACAVLLLHSLMDWDWQMPVVYLPFFFFAGGLLRYGTISRDESEGIAADSPADERSPGFSVRHLLNWKTFAVAGCLIVATLTIFGMLAEGKNGSDSELINQANQAMDQKDYSAALVTLAELESSAARAHIYNPLDAQPLKDEAVADDRQGVILQGQGKTDASRQKFDEAVSLWNQALSREPDNYKIYADLGLHYMETNQIDQAADNIGHARQLDPLESKILGGLEDQLRKIPGGAAALNY